MKTRHAIAVIVLAALASIAMSQGPTSQGAFAAALQKIEARIMKGAAVDYYSPGEGGIHLCRLSTSKLYLRIDSVPATGPDKPTLKQGSGGMTVDATTGVYSGLGLRTTSFTLPVKGTTAFEVLGDVQLRSMTEFYTLDSSKEVDPTLRPVSNIFSRVGGFGPSLSDNVLRCKDFSASSAGGVTTAKFSIYSTQFQVSLSDKLDGFVDSLAITSATDSSKIAWDGVDAKQPTFKVTRDSTESSIQILQVLTGAQDPRVFQLGGADVEASKKKIDALVGQDELIPRPVMNALIGAVAVVILGIGYFIISARVRKSG